MDLSQKPICCYDTFYNCVSPFKYSVSLLFALLKERDECFVENLTFVSHGILLNILIYLRTVLFNQNSPMRNKVHCHLTVSRVFLVLDELCYLSDAI